jgi:hypothetical protein
VNKNNNLQTLKRNDQSNNQLNGNSNLNPFGTNSLNLNFISCYQHLLHMDVRWRSRSLYWADRLLSISNWCANWSYVWKIGPTNTFGVNCANKINPLRRLKYFGLGRKIQAIRENLDIKKSLRFTNWEGSNGGLQDSLRPMETIYTHMMHP